MPPPNALQKASPIETPDKVTRRNTLPDMPPSLSYLVFWWGQSLNHTSESTMNNEHQL